MAAAGDVEALGDNARARVVGDDGIDTRFEDPWALVDKVDDKVAEEEDAPVGDFLWFAILIRFEVYR